MIFRGNIFFSFPSQIISVVTSFFDKEKWEELDGRGIKKRHVWIIAVIGLLLYASTIDNSFHLDDYYRVYKNPGIEKLWPISRHFTDPSTMASIPRIQAYRPLLPLTLSINYAVDGYYFRGYHIINITIHILATIVAYFLILELLSQAEIFKSKRREWLAFSTAILFLIHPVSGIPVNYICARDLLMVELFSMYALYRYIRMRRTGEKSWPIILAAFTLALLSKGNAVAIPGLILTYEWTLRRQFILKPEPWLRALPFIVIVVAYFTFTRFYLGFSELENVIKTNVPAWIYTVTQMKLHLFHYARNFFWPLSIHLDPYIIPSKQLDPAALTGFLFILFTLYIAIRFWKRDPLTSFSIFAYWILLVPTSSFIPFFAFAVDYRPYPSSIFLYLLVCRGAFTYLDKNRLIIAFTTIFFYFSAVSLYQNYIWRTDESLWRYSLSKTGSPLAHLNYAMSIKDIKLREYHLRKTLEMNPTYVLAKTNLGLLLIEKSDYEEGLSLMIEAVKLKPEWEQTKKWLRTGLEKIDKLAGSNQTVELLGWKAEAHYLLGQYTESISILKKVIENGNGRDRDYFLLGYAYQNAGLFYDSIKAYKNLADKNSSNYQVYFNMGFSQMMVGEYDDAIHNFQKVVKLNPSLDEARKLIATCIAKKGDSR